MTKIFDCGEDYKPSSERKAPRFLPFLYNVYKKNLETRIIGDPGKYLKTQVHIARWDLRYYGHEWWGEEFPGDLQDKVLCQPDVDITVEVHEFNDEDQAIQFIKDWWRNQ